MDNRTNRYGTVFNSVDIDRDELINRRELDFGMRAVNNAMLTNREVQYVNTVLEVRGSAEINFRMFAVICALSERVLALDPLVKTMLNKMDCDAMERKMQGCKDMFYMLDEKQDGFVEMDMCVVPSTLRSLVRFVRMRVFDRHSVGIQQVSNGHPIGIQWVSKKYPIGIQWVSNGHPIGIPWVSNRDP